jgi:hypothetical protein
MSWNGGFEHMWRVPLILLLTAFFLGSIYPQSQREIPLDAESAKKDVLAADAVFDKALLAGDTRALSGLWADDFLYAGTNGEILTKLQRLAQLRSGAVKYDALKEDDVRAVVYGDTVILSGRSTSTVLIGDKGSWGPGGISHKLSPGRLSGNALFTRVYVKLHGRWQIILEHETYITDD